VTASRSVPGVVPFGAQPAVLPAIREERIIAYGGQSIRTRVATPSNRQEVRAALEYARQNGLQVTFRGGGHAFDTQSLNGKFVISLERLRRIEVDDQDGTVTAEAGARWGDILTRTRPFGLVPYIMVTSSTTTAGGTVSSHSLSRFSPTLGREGQYVVRLSLMTPDGQVHECSSTRNPELFRAVVGGLGYMGAVLDVTHSLLRLPMAGADIAVHTLFELVTGEKEIALELVNHIRHKARKVSDAARTFTASEVWAVSAVVYEQSEMRGLIATSQYTSAPPAKMKPCVFHNPTWIGAWLLQFAALFAPLRWLGYTLVLWLFEKPKEYVDPLFGYTFFEDGNSNLLAVGRALGFPMGVHQFTFIIPYDPDSEFHESEPKGSTATLATFLETARTTFESRHVSPSLIDVLYLPEDVGELFDLSSSAASSGFAVTFTFEKPLSADFEDEIHALRQLIPLCMEHGGRVSLVKNVDADSAQVETMYAPGIERMKLQRASHGIDKQISNQFMKRVLGGLEPKQP
jgi:decaprenylphospho-beta-D-ribofuranose 2-oxidase